MRLRGPILAAALVFALAGCGTKPAVRIENAWVRPVSAGGTTAGYLTLVNDSPDSLVLVGVEAPAAGMAMMHETVREGGRATMREAPRLVVAPHTRLRFAPGGAHLMLSNALVELAEGDTTGITLRLADGGTLHATAKVRP